MACCRSEFRLKNFGFGGVSDREFSVPKARWYYQPFTYVIYRFAAAIYFIVWFFVIIAFWGDPPYSSRQADTKAKWFIYVSNWSFSFLCLYLGMSAIGTLLYHKRTHFKVSSKSDTDTNQHNIGLSTISGNVKAASNGKTNKANKDVENANHDHPPSPNHMTDKQEIMESSQLVSEPSLSWYFKVTWLLQNIAFAGALFVTILFWVLDFDYENGTVTVFNLHIHGVNLAFVVLDQFLIGSPYRLLHFIYPSLMALVYFIFSLIYFAAGGLNEYPEDLINGNTYLYQNTLDWGRHPTTSGILVVLVTLVAAPAIHLLYFGLYHLGRTFGRCCKCCGNKNES